MAVWSTEVYLVSFSVCVCVSGRKWCFFLCLDFSKNILSSFSSYTARYAVVFTATTDGQHLGGEPMREVNKQPTSDMSLNG